MSALPSIPKSWLENLSSAELAAGQSEQELLASYPVLTREDILACLSYPSELAHEYKAFPIPA